MSQLPGSLEATIRAILASTRELLGVPEAWLSHPALPDAAVPAGPGPERRAVEAGEPVVETAPEGAVLAVPVFGAGGDGVLAARGAPGRAFEASDVRVAEALARHAACALEATRRLRTLAHLNLPSARPLRGPPRSWGQWRAPPPS